VVTPLPRPTTVSFRVPAWSRRAVFNTTPSRTLPVDRAARLLHTPPLMFSNRSRGGVLVGFIFMVDEKKSIYRQHLTAGKHSDCFS
jgi:hypothetical protein